MAVLFGALWIVGAIGVALFLPRMFVAVHTHPAKVLNAVLPLVLLGIWAWVRKQKDTSVVAFRAAEFTAQFCIALAIGIGVATAPIGYHLELGGLLVSVFTLVLRAAFVPSRVAWTTGIGVICGIPVVIGGYLQIVKASVSEWISPPLATLALGMWCVAATAATAVVSRVIYGLVIQVQEAMQLGRYTLIEQIGEGGMGAVYRAQHAMLRRPTAVKLLLPERVSGEALARFEREVQLTSRLTHPNTVAIYDYGRTPDGIFYYAMEYLDGISLETLVSEDGPQPEGRVIHVLAQVAGALAEAHAIGLIHRDIKPANVMLCERGGMPDFAKVVDFGLVKKVGGAEGQVHLTSTNTLAGTPLYMAPESITRPDEIDARADLYALGAVAYYLLTGSPPFNGKTIVDVCGQHLHSQPVPPSERLGHPLNARLEGVVLACLEKSPEKRPRGASEVVNLLAECQGESPWSSAQAKQWWGRWREKNPALVRKDLAFERTVATDVA
jgi:serine/threonine-protein kinase